MVELPEFAMIIPVKFVYHVVWQRDHVYIKQKTYTIKLQLYHMIISSQVISITTSQLLIKYRRHI